MNVLQCLTLRPDGHVVATVCGHVHRFESIEALAAWLNPEPDFVVELDVTHRSLSAPVVTHFQERALTV